MIYHDKIFTAEECKEIRELMNISFIGKRADAEKVNMYIKKNIITDSKVDSFIFFPLNCEVITI